MAWDFSTDAVFEQRLAWVQEFVREEIVPLETLDMDAPEVARALPALQQIVKDEGLWAPHAPTELGGAGLSHVALALMFEVLGRCRIAPIVFGCGSPDAANAELLAIGLRDGDREAHREKWLRPLVQGELRSAFSMTEPGAGSDPTLLTTTAARDGDEWVLNGHKSFVANGSIADILLVVAVTNPDVHPSQGTSIIVVPSDAPGVRVVRDVPTMDEPGVGPGLTEITYTDVRVPYDHLVGPEGEGLALAQQRLGPSRIRHVMGWLGQAGRAFDMLCERAVSRYAHGSVLADKQTVQNWVADSTAEMTAARLMALHAAWKLDTEGAAAARVDIAMAKFYAASVLYNVVDRAIQVHGSLGFSADLPLEAMYRAARGARISEGPDEVHKVSVARAVLRDYKPVEVPSEHVPTRRDEAQEKFAAFLALADM